MSSIRKTNILRLGYGTLPRERGEYRPFYLTKGSTNQNRRRDVYVRQMGRPYIPRDITDDLVFSPRDKGIGGVVTVTDKKLSRRARGAKSISTGSGK